MRLHTYEESLLLTSRNVEVGYGADLLDADDNVVDDLTDDLISGSVGRGNYNDIHGTCTIGLLRALDWPNARVRLWQSLSAGGSTVTFPVGVFLLTTPTENLGGEDPGTWEVDGYDKLYLLQHIVTDTYVVPATTGYLDAVRTALTVSGYTGLPPLLDGTAQAKVLDEDYVWVLDADNPISWLRIINDLLAAIGYSGLWVDETGRFRSAPYQRPVERASEWTFDLADDRTNIVTPERVVETDEFERLNWWRFIRDDLETRPVENNGQYTVDHTAGGTRYGKIERLTAADQESLVTQGNRIVDEDTRVVRRLEISTGPLPILGHFDVATYKDPDMPGPLKVLAHSWEMPLDGSDVSLTLEVI